MTKKKLRTKTRKLAKELNADLLKWIDKSVECVECDDVDTTDNGYSYAILNAFLKSKQYPITKTGSNRLIAKLIIQCTTT